MDGTLDGVLFDSTDAVKVVLTVEFSFGFRNFVEGLFEGCLVSASEGWCEGAFIGFVKTSSKGFLIGFVDSCIEGFVNVASFFCGINFFIGNWMDCFEDGCAD